MSKPYHVAAGPQPRVFNSNQVIWSGNLGTPVAHCQQARNAHEIAEALNIKCQLDEMAKNRNTTIGALIYNLKTNQKEPAA
jgi:hypothetical protein